MLSPYMNFHGVIFTAVVYLIISTTSEQMELFNHTLFHSLGTSSDAEE